MPEEDPASPEAASSKAGGPASPPAEAASTANPNLLPRKTKLHPWEVESAIPEPGPEGENLPFLLRPAYRFYRYAISTPKRRNFYVQATRAVLIVGMCLLVTELLYPELETVNAPAVDPLTGQWTFVIPADNTTGVSGLVDGDDVIAGNFTVEAPASGIVVFSVLPSGTGTWAQEMAQNVYQLPQGPTGTVGWTAAYTDWYVFVLSNPTAHNETVYMDLDYLSSLPPV